MSLKWTGSGLEVNRKWTGNEPEVDWKWNTMNQHAQGACDLEFFTKSWGVWRRLWLHPWQCPSPKYLIDLFKCTLVQNHPLGVLSKKYQKTFLRLFWKRSFSSDTLIEIRKVMKGQGKKKKSVVCHIWFMNTRMSRIASYLKLSESLHRKNLMSGARNIRI